MDDDTDDFSEVLSSQYGVMESQMGQDGYKAFVEAQIANGVGIKAYADKNASIAGLIRVITGLCVLLTIPVIVLLWKVALQW